MAAKSSTLLDELVSEFIEERVRRHPRAIFDLDMAVKEVSAMLTEAGEKPVAAAPERARIEALLEKHPFLTREPGKSPRWKPGLDLAR